jgi:hypothetical protein
MRHLIYVNILMMLMDITLLGTEYANLYSIQITFKGTLYSVKLQLEFAILNQLMSLNQNGGSSDPNGATVTATHTGAGGVALETFRGKEENGDGSNLPYGYAVFAERMHKSRSGAEAEEEVGISKTTRIDVHVEHVDDSKKDEQIEERGRTEVKIVSGMGSGRTKSETSSEIEFASAGY